MSANTEQDPTQGELLMIVDDDRGVSGMLDRVLNGHGYTTMYAADGKAALEMLQKGIVPSVMLLDLMMPRMGGLELVERLERDDTFSGIPIILMSGHATLARGDKVRNLHLLPKPFDTAQLLRLVRTLGDARALPAGSAQGSIAFELRAGSSRARLLGVFLGRVKAGKRRGDFGRSFVERTILQHIERQAGRRRTSGGLRNESPRPPRGEPNNPRA